MSKQILLKENSVHFLNYFHTIKEVLDKINLDILQEINRQIFIALKSDKQVFTMGNGGSGATASHFICDLNKGISCDGWKRIRGICLNDNVPSILAYANDMSYSDIFCEQLKNYMKEGDVVIGFSGSGNSENVIKAMIYANENKGITIGFTGFDGGKLAKVVKYSLNVPIKDMQKSEDVHLMLCHLIMQTIMYWMEKGVGIG